MLRRLRLARGARVLELRHALRVHVPAQPRARQRPAAGPREARWVLGGHQPDPPALRRGAVRRRLRRGGHRSGALAAGPAPHVHAATAAPVRHATLETADQNVESFRWWVANRLMFLAAVTSIQGFAPYFIMYSFNVGSEEATSMTGRLITMVGIFTLLSALPAGWLSDRWGQKRLTGFSGLIAVLGTGFILLTIWQPDLKLLYLAGAVLGIATGLFVTINWALGTRLVPQAESGRWLGISNLAGAGAGMIGSGIGGPLADTLNAGAPGLGYFTIFAGYGLLFLFSTLCLTGIRKQL